MTGHNRLFEAASPYLLQHATNPVHWWPWCDAAFAEARALGKPVLLSVGYSACHWCHVMAHESFEHAETAAMMNALFVNIKVDREERPDVDQLYMSALHALGQQGGWPLTIFLDDEARPFWGGTYFPRESRYGQPAFRSVLSSVEAAYRNKRDSVASNAEAILAALTTEALVPARPPGLSSVDGLAQQICDHYDPVNGGMKRAPKFPNPSVLELMWRAADRTGDESIRKPVLKTLERMALGGIYDHVGGGFSRYSVDEVWLVPHFEKMLYDNAQLLPLLALAAKHTGTPLYRRAAEQTVEWLLREMLTDGGAFAASLDADSLDPEGHPEEGAYYVWTELEVHDVLKDRADRVMATFDITTGGNFEGKNIPNRLISGDSELDRYNDDLALLLRRREQRPPPGRDDKILADWNALMITGLVRAAELLHRPDWIEPAKQAFAAVLSRLGTESILGHSWRNNISIHPGFASDHAFMANAALALYEHTGQPEYLSHATRWCDGLLTHYLVPETGLLAMTAQGTTGLPLRPQPTVDDAIPNVHPAALEAFTRLFVLTGDTRWRDATDTMTSVLSPLAAANPFGHAAFFNALDLEQRRVDIVLAGESLSGESLAGRYITALAAISTSVPYTNRTIARVAAADTKVPHALVCARGICSLPIIDPELLRSRIEASLKPD